MHTLARNPHFYSLFLQNVLGQLSFTTDLWSDNDRTSYLALTAHWIGCNQSGNLKLRSGLPGFSRFSGAHMGEGLVKALMMLLDHASIMPKLSRLPYPFDLILT